MKLGQHREVLVRRVRVLNTVAQIFLFMVATAYWSVQVARGSHFRELADNNRLRKVMIEAPRGLIRDRLGRPLVENVPSYSLYMDRSRSSDLEASLRFAARTLGGEFEEFEKILEGMERVPQFKSILLAEHLSLAEAAQFSVETLEHPEFEIEVKQVRLYRHSYRTAHLLGYLGEVTEADLVAAGNIYRPGDLVGKKGIEERYEATLRGERGEQVVVVDSRGRRIREDRTSPAGAGKDLWLTLDLDLQQEAAIQLEGKVGTIVALDPRQGDILAMVSSPSFDPNRFANGLRTEDWRELVENPDHPFQNRAIQNVYPPGSVFKIVMALAGLDLGLVDAATTRVWCSGQSTIYSNVYRCWKAGGHGVVDLRRSLEGSCNVFYHQLGQKMEIDRLAEYAKRFGLGQKTGVDLGGEKAGLVPSQQWSEKVRGGPWYPGETISVATGQGPILATPLQVAVLMAAVANGGFVVTPRLVRGEEDEPPRSLGLAREHLDAVRGGLWAVVQGAQGTATRARVEGLEIAGKTGTAQVISQKQRTKNTDLPEEFRDHAWFASFAPFENPRLVVVVFIEHGGAGSASAAPLAKALYEKFLETDLAPDPLVG